MPSVTLAHQGLRCLRPVPRDFVPVVRLPEDLSPDVRDEEDLVAGRADPRDEPDEPRAEPDDPEPLELPYVVPPRPS